MVGVMSKNTKIIIGILIALIIVIGMVIAYKIIEKSVTERENFKFKVENMDSNLVNTVSHDNNKEYAYADVFYAKIEEINTSNGKTIIFIKGLEINDINSRGAFFFSVDNDTELLWRNTKIKLSDLKEGQNVSITSIGDVLESSPAKLTKVARVIVLDDEL